ncbi:MAG TPA: hypothetical protein VN819_01680 [Thermoplasmata archaeon]|nr:hypothetical protein [Thermoplasmata archaeon]
MRVLNILPSFSPMMTARPRPTETPRTWTGKRRSPETEAFAADPKVEKWYDERALKSKLSADNDLRKLRLTLERLDLSPAELIDLAKKDPDDLRARLVRYAGDLKRKGRLAVYVAKTLSGVRSFLEYWHVEFTGYPKLELIRGASIENERVPTPEELGAVLEQLSLRSRTVALLIAHSGLRPQVLGSYQAERGLTLGDLPELRLEPELRVEQIPFVIRVPAELSKTRKAYTTFGTQQVASVLLAYLRERVEKGEKLGKDSPVVARNEIRGVARMLVETARNRGGFVTTTNLITEVANALHAAAPAGVRWRPYVLRGYCSTRLLIAEGDGRISASLREAILGHDGGVAARYHVGKKWGPELLAEARKEYARASSFLSTAPSVGHADRDVGMLRVMLELLGVPEGKISEDDLKNATPEELKEKAEKYRGQSADARQRVVSNGEIPKLLGEGWTFVAALEAGQAVLRPPGAA